MLLALAAVALTAATGEAGGGALTIYALVEIRHPSRASWSPDGRRVAYVWDRGGVQDLYLVDAAGGGPKALTRHADGSVDGLFWSADGRSVLFERNGDLWRGEGGGGGGPPPRGGRPQAEGDVPPAPPGHRVGGCRGRGLA